MAFNKVILVGNLTADPELKQTSGGVSVCSFSIAVKRKYSKDGSNDVDFFDIQTWRQTAEFVSRYFKKGKPILVCGQLQNRSWSDQQGNKRYATEVVADEVSFVGNNEGSTEVKNEPAPYVPSAYTQNSQNFEPFPANAGEDGLPF